MLRFTGFPFTRRVRLQGEQIIPRRFSCSSIVFIIGSVATMAVMIGVRVADDSAILMVGAETSQVIEGVITAEMLKKILITTAVDPLPTKNVRTMCGSHDAGIVVISPETGLRTWLRAMRRSRVSPRLAGRLRRGQL
jgi:hypothetical protein